MIFLIFQRDYDTVQFMQTAPWLGLRDGNDGQIKQVQEARESPLIHLIRNATSAILSGKTGSDALYLNTMSKQAEAAGELDMY